MQIRLVIPIFLVNPGWAPGGQRPAQPTCASIVKRGCCHRWRHKYWLGYENVFLCQVLALDPVHFKGFRFSYGSNFIFFFTDRISPAKDLSHPERFSFVCSICLSFPPSGNRGCRSFATNPSHRISFAWTIRGETSIGYCLLIISVLAICFLGSNFTFLCIFTSSWQQQFADRPVSSLVRAPHFGHFIITSVWGLSPTLRKAPRSASLPGRPNLFGRKFRADFPGLRSAGHFMLRVLEGSHVAFPNYHRRRSSPSPSATLHFSETWKNFNFT